MSDNVENEESKSYNLMELLNLEKELEEESAAVLGGSDDKCCTYNIGYIKRQALYSCLTCCPESKDDITKAAGICLACSYKCHENHELIELYTKRSFKCDCATKQIPEAKCYFVINSESTSSTSDEKYEKNTSNQYNHNFSGTYCICKRPYPDPEDPVADEMIQCIICEDWYHTRHLKSEVIPKTNEYSEMICGDCINKNEVLKCYVGIAVNKVTNIGNCNDSTNSLDISVDITDENKTSCETVVENETENTDSSNNIETTKRAHEIETNVENFETPPKKPKVDDSMNSSECIKPVNIIDWYKEGAIFWPDDWRKSLCACVNCKKMYAENKLSFLLDPEDTIAVYEEKGMQKYDSYYDWAANSLSSLGHTQKIDLIVGFNHLKDKLKEFFDGFAKEEKVITESDIKNFFQKLNKEKMENKQNQQFFCR